LEQLKLHQKMLSLIVITLLKLSIKNLCSEKYNLRDLNSGIIYFGWIITITVESQFRKKIMVTFFYFFLF